MKALQNYLQRLYLYLSSNKSEKINNSKTPDKSVNFIIAYEFPLLVFFLELLK